MLLDPISVSASGTLAVGFLALFFALVQIWFFLSRRNELWHAWGAFLSLATLIYAGGVFLQYMAPASALNLLAERIQFTGLIGLVHFVYAFSLAYLQLPSRRFHLAAGSWHLILLVLIWATPLVITTDFTYRNFLFMTQPYVEPRLGPLGIIPVLYFTGAIMINPYFWIRFQRPNHRSTKIFLSGFLIWLALGLHDAIVTVMHVTSIQFLLEYGFLGFCTAILLVTLQDNIDLHNLAEERSLKLSREKLRYQIVSEIIFDYAYSFRVAGDNKLIYEWVAGPIDKITGYRAEELTTRNARKRMVHPEDLESVKAHTRNLLSGIADRIEYRIRKKTGEIRWLREHGRPLQGGEDMRVTHIYGAVQDVTERKVAEAALIENEKKYRLLVENANDAIFIAQNESILFPNPKTIELTGYASSELSLMRFHHLLHPEDREMVVNNHHMRLAGKNPPSTYTFRIINKQKEVLWVQLNVVLITWEGRPATLNFVRDITPQVQLEDQRREAQKQKAIGMLAGGLAHEFNNALASIIGNTELLSSKLDSDPNAKTHLKAVMNAARRMSDQCDKLVAFARGGKYQPRRLDINALIRDICNDNHDKKQPSLKIQMAAAEQVLSIYADKDQMKMMIEALLDNAKDALAQSADREGRIRISTNSITVDQTINTHDSEVKPGKYVRIHIQDNGVGMDPKIVSKLFDPFFTTKFHGRGMGMAAVYGIIKNHGGTINVFSEPGEGTDVWIYLPA